MICIDCVWLSFYNLIELDSYSYSLLTLFCCPFSQFTMSYLLYLTVSNNGIRSTSRGLAESFLRNYSAVNPDVKIITRDLNKDPIPHLDEEAITASFIPPEYQNEEQKAKMKFRRALIEEIKNSKDICIATPLWNWDIPSVLKAYCDHILMIDELDFRDHQHLAGKSVTCIVACGGAYANNHEENLATKFLKLFFSKLGATDIEVVCSELTIAGVLPGMDALIPLKEKSFAESQEILQKRGKTI